MKQPYHILIVDDDKDVITTLEILLRHHYQSVETEKHIANLSARLQEKKYDLVILDMNFRRGMDSGHEGLFWLQHIKKQHPASKVVLITAYGDVELAVEAMQHGAADFLLKPWSNDKLLGVLKKALSSTIKPLENKKEKKNILPFIGQAPAMQSVFEAIEKVAATNANVLLLGENGTGKSLIAKKIHEQSLRKEQTFVHSDLGALSESIFESELFGHVKGAFTDAYQDKIGYFEQAHGGTLFLDEVGNIPLTLQTKLLTVLQNRMIRKVGSEKKRKVDIRLITATNQVIHQLVEQKLFRQDLLYRINTIEIQLPPLRKRLEDLPILYEHFVRIFSKKHQKPNIKTDTGTLKKLRRYHWPGNIRELENSIERALIMCDDQLIRPEDFILSEHLNEPSMFQSFNLMEIEKMLIQKAIDLHQGNLTKAAAELGLTRTSLYRRLDKYDF